MIECTISRRNPAWMHIFSDRHSRSLVIHFKLIISLLSHIYITFSLQDNSFQSYPIQANGSGHHLAHQDAGYGDFASCPTKKSGGKWVSRSKRNSIHPLVVGVLTRPLIQPLMVQRWLHVLNLFWIVNSITPKSIPVGATLILFGRYVVNFYVRIDK